MLVEKWPETTMQSNANKSPVMERIWKFRRGVTPGGQKVKHRSNCNL